MCKDQVTRICILGATCIALELHATTPFSVGPNQSYKTISSALAVMKEGDTCTIHAGTYRECIEVKLNHVTLIGQGRVVITGCDEAGEMTPCIANGHPALKKSITSPVYDLFCGDHYLSLARFPDKTAPMTSNEDWEYSMIDAEGRIDFLDHAQTTFASLTDGYYVGLHGKSGAKHGKLSSWYSISAPISGLGNEGLLCVNAQAASSGFLGGYGKGNGMGFIIGAKAVLDAPGEWYTDGKEVIVIPPATGSSHYEMRTRLYGAKITGSDVRLENIHFKGATAHVDGNNVTLMKCAFTYISPFRHTPNDNPKNKQGQSLSSCWGVPENGTAGVFVKGDRFVAENCRFQKSWWCGMMIRGNTARVENCLFEDVDWIARRCAGLFSWGTSNVVRYCTLRNLGGAAIEGGNANWINQYAKNNIWEYNYMENVCQLIVDQGFFYVNHQSGSKPKANSIWRYNVGNGARGPAKGNWTQTTVGYYIDNSSSGYRVHNNIVIDANEAFRYNDTQDGHQAGKDILYYNNTFYACHSIGFGCWNPSGKSTPDAEVMLVNNLVAPNEIPDFTKWAKPLNWSNNLQSVASAAFRNPSKMDFTPINEKLKKNGIPILNQPIAYLGAVDPEKGMWRYGADESALPKLE